MNFETRVRRFAGRFVSGRSFELIVAPALADLQYEEDAGDVPSRAAVLRAVAGAIRTDVASQAGTFLMLMLVPTGYYFVLMTVCFDFFHGATGRDSVVTPLTLTVPLLFFSLAPVLACFWPDGSSTQHTE